MRLFGGVVAQRNHARINKQAAVAVFGKSRESADVINYDSGMLQRLDQRISEPLGELVERDQTVARVRPLHRGVTPGVAEADAAEAEPPRPDFREVDEQRLEEIGRAHV